MTNWTELSAYWKKEFQMNDLGDVDSETFNFGFTFDSGETKYSVAIFSDPYVRLLSEVTNGSLIAADLLLEKTLIHGLVKHREKFFLCQAFYLEYVAKEDLVVHMKSLAAEAERLEQSLKV